MLCVLRLVYLPPDTCGGWGTWFMSAPASQACQLALALVDGPVFNLGKNLLQMFFPCLPPLLRPPHSDNSGFHGGGKGGDKRKVSLRNETVLPSKGGGQDVVHRHLRTSALGKIKNISTTAGQQSTQNVFIAVTKGSRNEKWEHQSHTVNRDL